jgi:hypothetical protein
MTECWAGYTIDGADPVHAAGGCDGSCRAAGGGLAAVVDDVLVRAGWWLVMVLQQLGQLVHAAFTARPPVPLPALAMLARWPARGRGSPGWLPAAGLAARGP